MPKKVTPRKSTNTSDVQKKIKAAANNKGHGLGGVAQDSFTNLAARMGFGSPSVAEGAGYVMNRVTNDYWLMITMFRNHWISRRICELPALDMCKAWPQLKCELTPQQITKFERTLSATLTPSKIQETIMWARLFGGAGALPIIDGHEDILDQPLDLDEINPGTYKGVIVFDRWSGITPGTELSGDIDSPTDFGMPEFYNVKSPGMYSTEMKIHHSRILRFSGPTVPYPERAAQMNWGISVLEPAFEEIRKRDNASWAILQLLFRAQILTQVNPELAQMMSGLAMAGGATVGGGATKFAQMYGLQNELLSNQSMLILGKEGKLESHQYSFGGIADVLNAFEVAIAGATDGIPFSKLFGRSVTGLAQTNEGDEKMWEENVARKQNDEMRPQLNKLYPMICMSVFGQVPEDLEYFFPSIRVLTEKEKAELAKDGVAAIIETVNAGLITQKTAMLELKQLSLSTGMFTNITDNEISQADDEIKSPMDAQREMLEMNAEFGDSSEEDSAKPKKPTVGKDKPKKPTPQKGEDSADWSVLRNIGRDGWITLENGVHAFIDKDGKVIAGPSALEGKNTNSSKSNNIETSVKQIVSKSKMSAKEINNGYCGDFAVALVKKHPENSTIFEGNNHTYTKINNLYYDAESPQGVTEPEKLKFFENSKESLRKNSATSISGKEFVKRYGKSFNAFDSYGLITDLNIMIENGKGSERWPGVILPADYGFISGTEGADGDDIDCYVGPFHDNCEFVFVVNQNKFDGSGFDEHKCMIGYKDVTSALDDYKAGHNHSDVVYGSVKQMTMDQFKEWIKHPQKDPA